MPMTIYSAVIASLLLTALGSLFLALYAWQRRNTSDTSRYFTCFLIAVAFYQIGYTLKLALPTLPGKLFAIRIEYLGVVCMAPFWFYQILYHVGRVPVRLGWFRRALLLTVPCVTLVVVVTDDWHHLLYLNPHIEPRGPFLALHYGKGPWYLVQVVYNYGVTLAANILLWRHYRHAAAPFRHQAFLLLLGMAINWGGYAMHLAGYHPWGISPLAVFLPASAAVYAWALLRHRLFDLAQVSRHTLVERMRDAMLAFDPEGRLVDCNPAACRLLAVEPTAHIGLTAQTFCAQRPDLIAALASGSGCLEFTDSSGRSTAWELTTDDLDNGRGRPMGRLAIFHDISDLKQAEVELRVLNGSLHRRVEEETEKRLAHERFLAQQAKLMAMGEMIGAIAHQWRQPLATLRMNVEWFSALRKVRVPLSAEWEEFEECSYRQIQHMSSTIDEFRDFYRNDKALVRFSVIDPINEAIRLVAAQFAGHDVTMTIECAAELEPEVLGIPGELTQVILNLLANALTAIDEYRQTSGTGAPGQVTLGITEGDGAVVITVSNTGVEIPTELAERIYEPNFTTREATGGSGIGLYLSRMIVRDRFNGQLTHKSSPGSTTFTITLPPTAGEELP